jgi:O-methyltransferase involved in polyketide biosynthesis
VQDPDEAVQFTADDDCLCAFVRKPSRRSPLINRGYYARVAAVQTLVSQFLDHVKGNKAQIVSLGAGFDTTYFRMKNAFPKHLNIRCKKIIFAEIFF